MIQHFIPSIFSVKKNLHVSINLLITIHMKIKLLFCPFVIRFIYLFSLLPGLLLPLSFSFSSPIPSKSNFKVKNKIKSPQIQNPKIPGKKKKQKINPSY